MARSRSGGGGGEGRGRLEGSVIHDGNALTYIFT